ncbi:NADP-dependent oxidoreductase domain-containing protein [Lanmaoa asiatica]|nr:NADP-dependent oxidoreductase domain-containing protein [Lanmaoa asiatica]
MSIFTPVDKPRNPLARYRVLAPSADAYYNMGGNFIDTANVYQEQSSEKFIGEWSEQRGIRDQLVIATKYSMNYVRADKTIQQKLRTSYVDILYIHFWDFDTSVEEVMNGLYTLVQQGKVLYLGISDAPAWIVSKCNQYARDHGKTPFVIYQGAWNVLSRDFERDIIPMARMEGMALAPWNVLAAGRLRTDAEEERRRQTGEKGHVFFTAGWERTPLEREMSLALENVARDVGTPHITAIAIAYPMQKAPYVFPIVGGHKAEYLEANIDALRVTLTPSHIKFLESIVPFDVGFPHNLIGDGTDYMFVIKDMAYIEKQPGLTPIKPSDQILSRHHRGPSLV